MALNSSRQTWPVVLFAVVAAAAIALVGFFSWNSNEPRELDPIPNGYNDLAAAGKMIHGADLDVRTATAETLRQFVATNSAALERARLGLTRQCRLPAIYLADPTTNNEMRRLNGLAAVKSVVRAFHAEGQLAELEGRPMEAAASYLAVIKVGIACSHGGTLIDALVAIACESLGCPGLDRIAPKLNAAQSCRVEQQLEEAVAEWEPASEILRHDAMLGRNSVGGAQYFLYTLGRGIIPAWGGSQKRALAKYDTHHHRLIALEIQLAAHGYELENGRKAQGWGDLVPGYLKAIPQDPLTGGAFKMSTSP